MVAPIAAASPRTRGEVRFILDEEVRTLRDFPPTTTVLEWLREHEHRTGTKEGCAEGDCGACTVVLGELDAPGNIRFRAVNSCIRFLPALDGKALFTVESLKRKGALHPVQRALVECHASQCGFCTPGFVMSLFALYRSESAPSRSRIADVLSGNLCRCTGYRPIVDAALRMYEIAPACVRGNGVDDDASADQRLAQRLADIRPQGTLTIEDAAGRYFAPTDLDTLSALAMEHPAARILAGSTDVGLWVTKQHRDLPELIYVGDVDELQAIEAAGAHIEIGAGASLTDAFDALVGHYPVLRELCLRFASPPIRNAGTLGGNIANGSPIGDSMPMLIALGATLMLRRGDARREMALEDFYLGYQKTALAPGEIVTHIRVPLPAADIKIATYKISKRFDQDISAVCGAYAIRLDHDRIAQVRVAYGGMAATPQRPAACEAALVAQSWTEATVRAAMDVLDRDFAPITDMRASASYRLRVARNLLYRFYLESSGSGVDTRVVDYDVS